MAEVKKKRRMPNTCKKCGRWFFYPQKLSIHRWEHKAWRSWGI